MQNLRSGCSIASIDAVLGARRHDQPVADAVDALVVVRVHGEPLADQLRRE